MRRTVGLVLIGTGVFFLVLAPLVRFYVARQVIAAPVNLYQRTTLEAQNATYLDTGHLKIRKGVTLQASNTTRGDVRASDSQIAVWDSVTSIMDPASNTQVDIQSQRAAFDRRTAELLNIKGASVGGDTSVKQSGIGLFWPVDVKKKTYPYFDVTTKRAWPMVYRGEDRVHGVKAYRFTQQVPATMTETIKGGVPASLLGMKKVPKGFPGYDKKTKNVAADRYYQADVTVWVDPRTGAPINQDQKVRTTLRTNDGVDRLVVGDLDLKMTDASQRDLIKKSDDNAVWIPLTETTGPIGALILGLALIGGGVLLVRRGRRRSPEIVSLGETPKHAAPPPGGGGAAS